MTKTLLLTALSFSLLGCSSVADKTWEQDKVYNITVLHTNDHHGRFWQNRYGEYGMAARKTLIDGIRSEVEGAGGSVLLLSGGDINTGVPESDLQNAEPDFKGMSLIGYDAMAIGNHEFDNPMAILKQQEEWANFPLLSANIYDKKTNTRLFQPYQMFDLGGVKTAVIGLTTEDTAKVGNPEYVTGIDFKDPTTEARKVIAEVEKNEHPDLIFAVTHMGHYQNAFYGVNAPGDVTLARALPEGALDMIVGGHSQEPVCMEGPNVVDTEFKPGDDCVPDKQNGTYIMQAHEWGKYVGRADYQFKNGVLTLVNYRLIPVNLVKKVKINGESKRVLVEDKIEQDPSLLAFLTPFQENGQAELGNKVAESNAKLEGDRNMVRFQQTNLGRLVAKAQKERAKADFGVVNSGGVRDSIEAGTITYKDVLKVQPFGNQLTYVDMSGKEVLDYLNVVATKPVDTGAYAQFYGISMTVGETAVSHVKINGKSLDLTEQYRFSIPSFNAAGGDGYPNITEHPGFVNTGFVDAEVLKEYLESHSPLKVEEYQPTGEIVYQN
ncbi:bifunctional UDP-sugar hydrolase/5'-nucleotidase UshA [Psychromonas sp. 14N.309.X.WAT.B.A12]|nr:bifunctional UDP-sugar hydrolase/5'-nucleotidase UshA [Psychromonas sp. 14N.309.X.WAT.B.A12]MDN2664925.1 bifunctional UDP-sugar hydrolase/5'-nucleotidase UshA [Psychromonas sp. 14N.309.X.WAT.B.A12]